MQRYANSVGPVGATRMTLHGSKTTNQQQTETLTVWTSSMTVCT